MKGPREVAFYDSLFTGEPHWGTTNWGRGQTTNWGRGRTTARGGSDYWLGGGQTTNWGRGQITNWGRGQTTDWGVWSDYCLNSGTPLKGHP